MLDNDAAQKLSGDSGSRWADHIHSLLCQLQSCQSQPFSLVSNTFCPACLALGLRACQVLVLNAILQCSRNVWTAETADCMAACQGLQQLHDKHMLHLGIKPHNVLVHDFSSVVLSQLSTIHQMQASSQWLPLSECTDNLR